MKCNEVKKIIHRDPDVELAANSRLISHVKGCEECSAKYGSILKISMAVALKESVRLPFDFEDRVWKKIGEPDPSASWLGQILRPGWGLSAATAAAVVVLLAIVIVKNGPAPAANREIAVKPAQAAPQVKAPQEARNSNKNAVAAANAGKKQAAPAVAANKTSKEKTAQNILTQKQPDTGAPAGIFQGSAPFKGAALNPQANPAVKSGAVNAAGRELTAASVKGDDMAGDYAVYGNVIHPSKGETVTLKYRVKKAGNVRILVYDRRGRVVKRIYSGPREPGVFTELWKGDNDNGTIESNGIYVIFIKTDSIESKIKVALVK